MTYTPLKFLEPGVMEGGGDVSREFFYLAGPMSNLPALNFPEFHRVAGNLRSDGWNIVNPAELDEEIQRKLAETSVDGQHDSSLTSWEDCLRRDISIVANPNCLGVILLDGWEQSRGAQFETYVAMKLGLALYELREYEDGSYRLVGVNRRLALEAAGVVDA